MGSVLLVRHGQASAGAADYDQLCELGMLQAQHLGYAWEASGWRPTLAVSGSMKRHHQTAIATLDALGDVDGYDVDADWNELDLEPLLEKYPTSSGEAVPASQLTFAERTKSWSEGGPGGRETFVEFRDRVLAAFGRACTEAGSGRTVVVFTSGGPIAMVATHLLGGDAQMWRRLAPVVINASVTTAISGSKGQTLIAFNEHMHLPASDVTYH